MKLLISAFGILCVSAVVTAKPFWCPWCQQPTFTEYGPNIERDGFCPNEPRESLCDTNFCNQDNNCEDASKKCCPTGCGGLICLDPVPGVRRTGNCPDFWKVPVEKYPETPINECETDDNCSNATHKCCDTDTHGIRKCVAPLENQ